ncbi:MAG TPA: NUDIX hydrolase [Motilibacteraceae bacterium]|nr:NUDIX hydrolase [Motilibacteraceae bacterium]
MRGDGDGWTRCDLGHEHWGLHGAAGLLVRAPGADHSSHVLLQHRAQWSASGGTWGVPGGARDSHESAEQAAVREAGEETSLDADALSVRAEHDDDHGRWSYVTVVADAPSLLPTVLQRESIELRWVREDEVEQLPLHPHFALSWPRLRARPVRLVVDAANVVGSRPDGWWRDRAGAAERLLDRLSGLPATTVALPEGGFGWVADLLVVVEGAARRAGTAAAEGAGVTVVRAAGSGDDALVDVVTGAAVDGAGIDTVVVTADRGLRARLPQPVAATGPGWLLAELDRR